MDDGALGGGPGKAVWSLVLAVLISSGPKMRKRSWSQGGTSPPCCLYVGGTDSYVRGGGGAGFAGRDLSRGRS